MTKEEAEIIAKLISQVDSGCKTCAKAMVVNFNEAFPAFTWEVDEEAMWTEHCDGYDLDYPLVTVVESEEHPAGNLRLKTDGEEGK